MTGSITTNPIDPENFDHRVDQNHTPDDAAYYAFLDSQSDDWLKENGYMDEDD